MNISEKYTAWLACPAMNDELMQEHRTMDEQARNDSFYRDLAFGDGVAPVPHDLFPPLRARVHLGHHVLCADFRDPPERVGNVYD